MTNWISFFVRYRLVIVAATVLGLLASLGYCWLRPAEYVGTTRLFFSTGAVDVSEVYQGTLAGQDRVRTYAALAEESKVINGAIKASGISASEETVRHRMKVDVPPGTVLIDISVTSQDLSAAVKLSNALADQLVALVGELEKPLGGGPPPVAMTVVASSAGIQELAAKFKPLYIGIGVGAGLLVGILASVGLEVTRNRRVRAANFALHDDRNDTEALRVSPRER
jgi:receptor protein-tyrosine kinase